MRLEDLSAFHVRTVAVAWPWAALALGSLLLPRASHNLQLVETCEEQSRSTGIYRYFLQLVPDNQDLYTESSPMAVA